MGLYGGGLQQLKTPCEWWVHPLLLGVLNCTGLVFSFVGLLVYNFVV